MGGQLDPLAINVHGSSFGRLALGPHRGRVHVLHRARHHQRARLQVLRFSTAHKCRRELARGSTTSAPRTCRSPTIVVGIQPVSKCSREPSALPSRLIHCPAGVGSDQDRSLVHVPVSVGVHARHVPEVRHPVSGEIEICLPSGLSSGIPATGLRCRTSRIIALRDRCTLATTRAACSSPGVARHRPS